MGSIREHLFLLVVPLLLATLLARLPEPITDPEAYAIYATVLAERWPLEGQAILLQQETTIEQAGTPPVPEGDLEWQAARDAFFRENASGRVLQPLFGSSLAYRLITKAEIDADDARLAVKYPGIWQRRPESLEYAAVSVVGFNAANTKAIVYVRFRSRGGAHYLEKRDGAWVRARLPFAVVGWVA